MGQLSTFSLEDISIITITAGPVYSYLSEEIDSGIERVVVYVYSTTAGFFGKKRVKVIRTVRPAGDHVGAIHGSFNFLQLARSKFSTIYKPLEDRIPWQDPFLSQWEGLAEKKALSTLEERYKW